MGREKRVEKEKIAQKVNKTKVKFEGDHTNQPKILQKVTLQHTLPHPPMSFSSDTEDRAS